MCSVLLHYKTVSGRRRVLYVIYHVFAIEYMCVAYVSYVMHIIKKLSSSAVALVFYHYLFFFQNTFKAQGQLEYLDLSHNSLSKLQPHFFSNLNRLLWLNISHNDVGEIHGRIFARNSLLRYGNFGQGKFKSLIHHCVIFEGTMQQKIVPG